MEDLQLREGIEDEDEDVLLKLEEEARVAAKDVKSLMSHPGWKFLVDFMTREIETRRQKVMLTKRSEIDDWDREFMRGEAAAFELILKLPQIELDNHSAVAAAREEERKNG